ncbi:5'-nucleotidase /3'-nucleotidase /exopolyphosphatase [Saccharicrinis carchari]|uniref:5'-nucleotidase SurE n=1 Tax=Saccharicrinis carchari TaxID=1168039 RepID=A0A521AME9_SACCC|nr:5'/3'-nucleotidase SurE [Saccharicrinis carchari]SMO35983.1 5'-nucleotidase /3'-nucleotidase /exopolyphosphatase [Saccharicrinis carchari]
MINKPLILITNDDGIHAKGIACLVEAMKEYGDLVVVSADESHSGMSHAITVKKPLYLKDMGEKDGVRYYMTNGTPVDCVKLALHTVLHRYPDYIVSGINHGSNSSTSVHYSGTLGAAREGALNGIPAIGFSLLSYESDADFTECHKIIKVVFEDVLKNGLAPDVYLNVNIPYTDKVKGIKYCRQGKGKWVEDFIERTDPRGRQYFWLTGHFENLEPEATDTDEYYLDNDYASVVPCSIDATDSVSLKENKNYEL